MGNEFYYEELFIVEHRSGYSCEGAICFNLTMDIVGSSCDFDFCYNRTDVALAVLDGGDEVILADWPNDKCIICNISNDIPVGFPGHPCVLVNRGVLCDCGVEADNHHLLELLPACDKKHTKLTMYFTINLAFTNYLDLMPNIMEQLTLNRGKTSYKQPLPVYLNISCFDK